MMRLTTVLMGGVVDSRERERENIVLRSTNSTHGWRCRDSR